MPVFEYLCRDCGKICNFLILGSEKDVDTRCNNCSSTNLHKIISRINVVESEESRLERLADPSNLRDIDYKDPMSVAKWMKRMGKHLGEDMGEEIDRIAEEAAREASAKGGKEEE